MTNQAIPKVTIPNTELHRDFSSLRSEMTEIEFFNGLKMW
jgi:hypothetical protein